MAKKHDWKKVGEIIAKVRELGLSYEVARVETQLAGREMDLERGYVIYKFQEHRVCVCSRAEGLEVYLDGKLLKEADGDGSQR